MSLHQQDGSESPTALAADVNVDAGRSPLQQGGSREPSPLRDFNFEEHGVLPALQHGTSPLQHGILPPLQHATSPGGPSFVPFLPDDFTSDPNPFFSQFSQAQAPLNTGLGVGDLFDFDYSGAAEKLTNFIADPSWNPQFLGSAVDQNGMGFFENDPAIAGFGQEVFIDSALLNGHAVQHAGDDIDFSAFVHGSLDNGVNTPEQNTGVDDVDWSALLQDLDNSPNIVTNDINQQDNDNDAAVAKVQPDATSQPNAHLFAAATIANQDAVDDEQRIRMLQQNLSEDAVLELLNVYGASVASAQTPARDSQATVSKDPSPVVAVGSSSDAGHAAGSRPVLGPAAGSRPGHASGSGSRAGHASGSRAGHAPASRAGHASGSGSRAGHASGSSSRAGHASGSGSRAGHTSASSSRAGHVSGSRVRKASGPRRRAAAPASAPTSAQAPAPVSAYAPASAPAPTLGSYTLPPTASSSQVPLTEANYQPLIDPEFPPFDPNARRPIYPAYAARFHTSQEARDYRRRVRVGPKDQATDIERVRRFGRQFWVRAMYEAMIDISDVSDGYASIHRTRFTKDKGFEPGDLEAVAHHIFDNALAVHLRGWNRPRTYHKKVVRGKLLDLAERSIETRLARITACLRHKKATVDDAMRGGVTMSLLCDNPEARGFTKMSNNTGNQKRGERLKAAPKIPTGKTVQQVQQQQKQQKQQQQQQPQQPQQQQQPQQPQQPQEEYKEQQQQQQEEYEELQQKEYEEPQQEEYEEQPQKEYEEEYEEEHEEAYEEEEEEQEQDDDDDDDDDDGDE